MLLRPRGPTVQRPGLQPHASERCTYLSWSPKLDLEGQSRCVSCILCGQSPHGVGELGRTASGADVIVRLSGQLSLLEGLPWMERQVRLALKSFERKAPQWDYVDVSGKWAEELKASSGRGWRCQDQVHFRRCFRLPKCFAINFFWARLRSMGINEDERKAIVDDDDDHWRRRVGPRTRPGHLKCPSYTRWAVRH